MQTQSLTLHDTAKVKGTRFVEVIVVVKMLLASEANNIEVVHSILVSCKKKKKSASLGLGLVQDGHQSNVGLSG